MQKLWGRRSCVLVTGASKGIGKTIAVEFAAKVAPGSLIIITARSEKGLKDTKDQILSANPGVNVRTSQLDLEKPCEETLQKLVAIENPKQFEQAFIIHNAGSLGNLSKWACDIDDLKEVQDFFTLNLASMMVLNSAFIKAFPRDQGLKLTIVNITSLWAIQPCKNFAFYCTAKAAREMFLKVVAEENPEISVLSYSPGPVFTDMADELLAGLKEEDMKTQFMELRTSGGYLSTEQTVGKLIQVLEAAKYTSGDHVDYFEPI